MEPAVEVEIETELFTGLAVWSPSATTMVQKIHKFFETRFRMVPESKGFEDHAAAIAVDVAGDSESEYTAILQNLYILYSQQTTREPRSESLSLLDTNFATSIVENLKLNAPLYAATRMRYLRPIPNSAPSIFVPLRNFNFEDVVVSTADLGSYLDTLKSIWRGPAYYALMAELGFIAAPKSR